MKIDEKTVNPTNTSARSCRREKNLRTRNYCRILIENLLPEKHNENM